MIAPPGPARPAPEHPRWTIRAMPGSWCRKAPAPPCRRPLDQARSRPLLARHNDHAGRSLTSPRELPNGGFVMKRTHLPHQAGVGFKPEHFQAIKESHQPIGFFEVHAENYMGDGGPPHAQLTYIRENYA